MAIDSDTATAIVAILVTALVAVITINGPSIAIINRLSRLCIALWKPSATTCASLQWSEIVSVNTKIRLHEHSEVVQGCTQCQIQPAAMHTSSTRRCWESGIQFIFQRVWKSDSRRVPKPEELGLNTEYLRTDMDTIISYLLLTAKDESFNRKMIGNSTKYFKIQRTILTPAGDIIRVGHLGSPRRKGWQLDLTVGELDKIRSGWPPFYRQRFTSFEGHTLDSPMQSAEDIRRPGWVIALGLSPIEPTAFYVERERNSNLLSTVMGRLRSMVDDSGEIMKRWRDNKAVASILRDTQNLLKSAASLEGAFDLRHPVVGRVANYPELDQNSMAHLSREECVALMDMFNGSRTRLVGNDGIISGNIVECMKRVRMAVWVLRSYKRFDRVLTVPPELEEQVIYLGPCS